MKKRNFNVKYGYLMLIFISTFFMSMAYAKISDVGLDINGTVEATRQTGVFISDVVYVSNVNADINNSKINYSPGTMLDSYVVLGNDLQSSITYQVSLYNNSDKEYLFIDILTDKTDTTLYSNKNIKYTITGLEEYTTTIASKASLTFTITFSFEDEADVSLNTLSSKLNFRFKEVPKLVLSNEGGSLFAE